MSTVSDELKTIQTIGRNAADLMQEGRLKSIIQLLCNRVDELETLNRMLNTFHASTNSGASDEIEELKARLASIEKQLPNFSELEITIGTILTQRGYAPRR